jgi:hypothetical protein
VRLWEAGDARSVTRLPEAPTRHLEKTSDFQSREADVAGYPASSGVVTLCLRDRLAGLAFGEEFAI